MKIYAPDTNSSVSGVAALQRIASAGKVEEEPVYVEREPSPHVVQAVAWSPNGSDTGAQGYIRALSERLCEEHPQISTYEGIFGGIPHLKGQRIAVADIIEQLYLTGSVSGVQRVYSPDVSKEQIKEAIAYAQDFIETALCPSSEVDG